MTCGAKDLGAHTAIAEDLNSGSMSGISGNQTPLAYEGLHSHAHTHHKDT